ncbi:rab effector MyRIP isoform X2 [Silurus meridionalis]|uniref:RabBD domain-containing protein n=2 Tax=Silurus meridionalis TaxID=175797 RepID=A0A8T0BWD5_SILME|nr:rab effector MyRIP isoform X2 [Silurus meridionalis]XP_046701008.1 rab effector MyRIP isoform X2 [Silurus meridionalis]KAF7709796.1 hypothetical protein HF521_016646 [Silurus meridionalis]
MTQNINEQAKLDLSRLTDEEARHIWQVIQRDFNLRKKEETRLGNLKSNILTEDTKRNLLTYQSNLSNSFCIYCMQPFKFLLKRKCQCKKCKTFTCKACSWFNKKERGWLCDLCHMAKVLIIGQFEWFHQNVYDRFKQSGSAKVMMSLSNKLHGDLGSNTDHFFSLLSIPDVRHSKSTVGECCKQQTFYFLLSQAESAEEALSLVDLVELELKQRLKKLTENISDKEKSSDEEEDNQGIDYMKPLKSKQPYFSSALKRKRATSADSNLCRNELTSLRFSVDIERHSVTQRRLSLYEFSTARCELSRLENEVAMAVARVQSAQSVISDIEHRIAALGKKYA